MHYLHQARPVSRVLVVDDEQSIRTNLRSLLVVAGYESDVAEDVRSAERMLANGAYDVVVADIVLPRESGVALLRRIRRTIPNMPVIMMTANPSIDTAAEALRVGASDYLTKPLDGDAVLRSVANAAWTKRLDDLHRRVARKRVAHQKDLERLVETRTRELETSLQSGRRTTVGTIRAMALAVESRDPYTAAHQRRVAHLARAVARQMSLSKHEVNAVYHASLVHDLGKLGVPAEILANPGVLCREAICLVRKHPESARRILARIRFPWPLDRIVFEHHERLDGSGYPGGIAGDRICVEARVLAVADVVEAMASHRPYRPSLGIDAALDEIREGSGIRYDPGAVAACDSLFRTGGFAFKAES